MAVNGNTSSHVSSGAVALRRMAKRAVRALPPPRDKAALRAAVALRDLVRGTAPAPKRKPARSAVKAAPRPRPAPAAAPPAPLKLPKVEPLSPDAPWLTPENITGSGFTLTRMYEAAPTPIVFDVDLLEALNREYADRPLVPKPPTYDAPALVASARRRIGWVHGMVDLRDKRTLEVGCGNGFEVWAVAHNLGADAHGVDVSHYEPWDQLAGDRVHFTCADMSVEHPFEPNSFDRILSFTVWEHVSHPYAMLKAAHDVLKPGGLAWIRVNLYAGPQASHRYREIFFPWPHLLFSDEVVREWDLKHGRKPLGNAWVNRLSYLHYDRYVADLGFEVLHRVFSETPIDEELYTRFEDVLGRYPRADLRRDFMLMVLRKPL